MVMIGNLIRFSRRQLHTIVSREIIKPSSPTPSHLKTYNLSLIDQIVPTLFAPIVTFYPNTGIYRDKTTLDLKNSLSQTLTKYYTFAGRINAKVSPSYVNCNDKGAEFLEATIDTTLSDFLQNSKREDLDQFFPHGLVNYNSNHGDDQDLQSDEVTPLEVQVNHFECGGVAVAVSLSHKVADGSSLFHFLNDWAKITRFGSTAEKHEIITDPEFIQFQYMNVKSKGLVLERSDDCVTRSFVFPNSKINELKLEVKAMTAESGEPITNPTRVEVLTWLLYKCSVEAAKRNNSGSFIPIGVGLIINLRSNMIEKLPAKTIGNFVLPMEILTKNESEMNPKSFISELRKQKMQFQAIRNIETAFGILLEKDLEEDLKKHAAVYICSSLCGYSAYDIDFGWGKPIQATHAGDLRKDSFILMDAPNGDGIEALVCLGNQDMDILQSDPELLNFC
ncbi:unnamed protein product [Lactuca saligna]|uniref:Transferase, Chloramphenicol acetyltransferase-like domain protein n=2 Tax=Lactuca saligna TaxID=75948 RepID=A0AA35YXE5_LACSI|nr:unnamed protein product [Lactuca saligna]